MPAVTLHPDPGEPTEPAPPPPPLPPPPEPAPDTSVTNGEAERRRW